ncbi:hypothetical protein TGP89_321510 [Toxoplasma gondii p89]|uniref:Uncharacterized protein n=1 Tax=Toxoplasma gondii p89 TaxID=943119 RepID=A0A086J7G0_TOXGO|nr:hypothetical protein TGP89_321510 [Toxoplasma gondii p89]
MPSRTQASQVEMPGWQHTLLRALSSSNQKSAFSGRRWNLTENAKENSSSGTADLSKRRTFYGTDGKPQTRQAFNVGTTETVHLRGNAQIARATDLR